MIIKKYKNELVCDIAETYGVLDIRAIPARTLAVLAIGLRPNSRVYMAHNEAKATIEEMLHAAILDNMAFIAWTKTVDGQKNKNRPKSFLGYLLDEPQRKREINSYNTPEAFNTARDKIMKGG